MKSENVSPEEQTPKKGRKKKSAEASAPSAKLPCPITAATLPLPRRQNRTLSPKTPKLTQRAVSIEVDEPVEPPANMEELARTIEALLFAARSPSPHARLRAPPAATAQRCEDFAHDKEAYAQQRKPWEL